MPLHPVLVHASVTGLAAIAAHAAVPGLAPLLVAALPWILALGALPMVIASAHPLLANQG